MKSAADGRVEPPLQAPPFVLHWSEDGLPRKRIIAPPARGPRWAVEEAPPYWYSGIVGQAFDFSEHMRRLTADIAQRSPAMRHLDVSRLLFTYTQARNARMHGLQARVTPLRFRQGRLTHRRRGIEYQVQRYFVGGREQFYVLSFCMPRFQNQGFDEKLITLFHELYHICPTFNGDLRRHEGRYAIHTHSQKRYDEEMALLAREYLSLKPPPELHGFLRLNFAQLERRHGSVMGVLVPRPKVIPVTPRPNS